MGPGYDDLDASVVKDTAVGFLGEGGEVEFRGEFFNLPNHPNFTNPGTTAVSASCGGSVLACTMNRRTRVAQRESLRPRMEPRGRFSLG